MSSSSLPLDDATVPGHISLIGSSLSLSNTTFSCDSLGIHYRLSSPPGLKANFTTTFTKWSSQDNKEVLIAEWERHITKADRWRMPLLTGGEWIEVKRLFPVKWAAFLLVSLTFTASNGKKYSWKCRPLTVKLFSEDNQLIAAYHPRYLVPGAQSSIDLFPGSEDIIDDIVVTWAYTEQKRREGSA